MKHTTSIRLAIAVILLVCLAATAGAGWRNKELEQRYRDRQERAENTPRYDEFPTMAFHMGELRQDSWRGWTLGDLSLQVLPDCEITGENGGQASLTAGYKALVMGPRLDDTVLAWSIRVLAPDWNKTHDRSGDTFVQQSDVDSTVGEGHGPE